MESFHDCIVFIHTFQMRVSPFYFIPKETVTQEEILLKILPPKGGSAALSKKDMLINLTFFPIISYYKNY